jgi:hypothetical protein
MTATRLAPWPAGASTAIGPILAATWLAQLSLGLALQAVDPLPQRPLLIERRSCAPGQWQELVERYRGVRGADPARAPAPGAASGAGRGGGTPGPAQRRSASALSRSPAAPLR